ncbi:MAG: diguanylate cyclase [Desulfarculus sp.]|nr:diguanylate cyclase [Desulfarculus sp.]
MVWRSPWRSLRNLPVGIKLPATLILVVVITVFCLGLFLDDMFEDLLGDYALHRLERGLNLATAELEGLVQLDRPPGSAFKLAQDRLANELGYRPRLLLAGRSGFEMSDNGQPAWLGLSSDDLGPILATGMGSMRRQGADGSYLVVYRRLKGGAVLLAAATERGLIQPVLRRLHQTTVLLALSLCLVVGLFAVWLSCRELTGPLRRLTAEAERVAAGDLTPSPPLAERQDELGRLSRALQRMTQAAQVMVEQARSSQLHFHQLFTDIRDAAFIIDAQGRVEDINPAGLAIFGYDSLEQIRALPDTEALFADSQERQGYLALLQQQGYVQDHPVLMRRRDGQVFNALITATARPDGQRRFGLVRDVTSALAQQHALEESEERYRRLVENAPDVIYRWDIRRNCFAYISPAIYAVTGRQPEEIINNTEILWEIIPSGSRRQLAQEWQEQIRGEGPLIQENEFQILHLQGGRHWLRVRSILVRDAQGRPVGLEGIATDITERRQAEQALRQGRRMLEATLDGLPAAVMVVDHQHLVAHWNRAMTNLTGVPAEEVVGTNRQWLPFYKQPHPVMADLIVDQDLEGLTRYYGDSGLKRSRLVDEGWEAEAFFPELGGQPRHIYFLSAPVRDESGQVVLALETLVDLSEKRKLEEELVRLSITDELTGLYNQRFFYATLYREIEAAKRYGQSLCLLMLDLDRFKSYNDRFGHLEGDRVLKSCGQDLRRQVRTTDLACRYGGEEFVVLLPRTFLEEACRVAQRVREGIKALVFQPPGPDQDPAPSVGITVSLGVAEYRSGLSAEDLVRRADQALYAAKEAGRDRVAVHRGEGKVEVL